MPRYKTPNNASLVGIDSAAACWGRNAAAPADMKRATGPLGRLEPLRLQPAPGQGAGLFTTYWKTKRFPGNRFLTDC